MMPSDPNPTPAQSLRPTAAMLQQSVQRHVGLITAEAAQIGSGTLDYCMLLGAALGFFIGVALPAKLSGNLDLANSIIQDTLFNHLASVVVVSVVSLRVILARGMQDQLWVSVDDGHNVMLRHILASGWAASVALVCFLIAALVGYALGLALGLPGLVTDMLYQLADSYSVSGLFHLILRVWVEAAAVAWISFFDMILLSAHSEDLSRSITRKLFFLVMAVIGIEVLDAYIFWTVY